MRESKKSTRRRNSITVPCSVVDLHHVDADQDSTYHPDEDPNADPYFYLMRIQIFFDAIVDFYPTFHQDADPDPDHRLQIKAQPLKSAPVGSCSIHFGLSAAN